MVIKEKKNTQVVNMLVIGTWTVKKVKTTWNLVIKVSNNTTHGFVYDDKCEVLCYTNKN